MINNLLKKGLQKYKKREPPAQVVPFLVIVVS